METAPWQGSLLAAAEVATFDPTCPGLVRHDLAHDAWLDHLPGWLEGADGLFDEVVDAMAWHQGTELIQGDEVLRPRLTASLAVDELCGAVDVLRRVGACLSDTYAVNFERVGVNLYRDGRDSVAWHGDRIARDRPTATIAIVSLGQARPFRARPADGGASLRFDLGHGDLLVMGGTFQRTWKHAVPKVARAGPRISVTYRHAYSVPAT
ncbi:MAG: alpha-ketoglutarate-dependent dioxygenase AlkB [Nitriliruptor sp.]|nr:MAG: alpha-ketoglutarate-dependent dioxygenase AlkB [Nitriliruptor sp.]